MSSSPPPSRDSNPFATCWTRPGALGWAGAPGVRVEEVADRLRGGGWRGQVVGGHGSGKSTLLAALQDRLLLGGEACVLASPTEPLPRGSIALVEAFERLPRRRQHALLRRWRRDQARFVVTTHRPLWPGLATPPVIASLAPDERLVATLYLQLTERRNTPVTLDDALARWRRQRGDLRGLWFQLYELHEQTTHPGRTATRVQAYTIPSPPVRPVGDSASCPVVAPTLQTPVSTRSERSAQP